MFRATSISIKAHTQIEPGERGKIFTQRLLIISG